jgi:TPP-dependent pyruvate/acetoin dehydrogenase alpha subunit
LGTSEIFQAIDSEVKKEVDEAARKAKTDTEIPMEELPADIYSAPLEENVRNVAPWEPLHHKRIGAAVNLK